MAKSSIDKQKVLSLGPRELKRNINESFILSTNILHIRFRKVINV